VISGGGLDPLALGYLAVEWTIRIAMLVIVPFRRSPDAARGWLLIVFILPVPALVLYLMIGRPTYPRWRRRRFDEARRLLANATHEIEQSQPCCQPALPENLASAALLIEHLGQFPTLGGNSIELLADYEGMIDRVVADIDQSSDHVHILTYIFADDRTGGRVIDALLRAAARGVACRVLVDAFGSRPWAWRLRQHLTDGGVEVERALPVSFFQRRSARTDLRNHRKIAVIDGLLGYIGSQNLIAADFVPNVVNRELVVRANGPVVIELQAVFAFDWFLETGRVLDAPTFFRHGRRHGGVIAQLLPSGPDYPVAGVGRLVVALVHGARQRVVITTPYFIPDEALLQALQTAVLRGVEVLLIVSRLIDNPLVGLAQRSYYDELLRAGVAIHLFRDGLMHAKHLSIDDEISVIGSSNMDIRSFLLNAEASLVIYDQPVTRRLQAEQQRILAASDRLVLSEWARRHILRKLIENIARLVSPLL
jgi:cardiolipin synthase